MKASRNAMRSTPPAKPAVPDDLDPRPHIFIAPELRGREDELKVIRHEDDTDEEYASRCELVALILETAKKS
jgi:hypothetical protein